MITTRQSAPHGEKPQHRRQATALLGLLVALGIGLSGCDGNGGTLPGDLRYGQLGEVEVELVEPLRLGVGSRHQILTWGSSGAWSLHEFIAYRGLLGEDTFQRNPGDPSPLAAGYASFITLVNEVDGLKLFIDELPQDLEHQCDVQTRTTITLTVRDDARDQEWQWTRCTNGSLSTLMPSDAGPDVAAARVVSAAMLVRDATVGPDFVSAYHGSLPFGTLGRGEDTNASVTAPQYVLDDESWQTFWQSHTGTSTPPTVNFADEMVIVAAVGTRQEAGDSVEVRRILQVDQGTLTYVFERVPGDFCSPAARPHVPFHIVVAPRTPAPYRFADVELERVTCGG